MIDGLVLTENKVIKHPKGDIFHIIKTSSEGFEGFGEVYISSILKNDIKGWKKHKKMILNLTVVYGKVNFAIFDDRSKSNSNGEMNNFVLGPNINYSRLTVPPGLWVAFKGIEDTNLVLNLIPSEHDQSESDDKPLNFKIFPK